MRPTRVSQTGAGTSVPIILEIYGRGQYSLNVDVTGTVNYTVQFTNDNLFDTVNTPVPVWFDSPDPDVVAATTSKASFGATGPFALRLVVNSGNGSAAMTVLSSTGL